MIHVQYAFIITLNVALLVFLIFCEDDCNNEHLRNSVIMCLICMIIQWISLILNKIGFRIIITLLGLIMIISPLITLIMVKDDCLDSPIAYVSPFELMIVFCLQMFVALDIMEELALEERRPLI